MRANGQYLQKVQEELSVYQKRLKFGEEVELTETQEENWDKIQVIWKLLKDGETDSDILKLAQNHPGLKVMNRRARELLYMTYETFADLRLTRNTRAIKMLDSESYREAAQMVMCEIKEMLKEDEEWSEEAEAFVKKKKDYANAKEFLKIWRDLKSEAGKIDGVYLPDSKNQEEKKKPKTIVIKKLIVNQNIPQNLKQEPIDTTYEIESDS